MADLHVLFPAQQPRRDASVEARSEAPLLPDATQPSTRSIGAGSVFRLSIRHALLSRRPLFLCMALTAMLPILGLFGKNSITLLTGIIVPIFAVLAAIDGEGKTERFWVGMGGPPGVRELARVLLDQVVINGLFGLAVLSTVDSTSQWALGMVWLASLTLYGLGGLTRSIASSTQGRMGVMIIHCVAFLGLAALPQLIFGWITLIEVIIIQCLAVSTVGVAARVLVSGRWSAAGAARRKWSPAWLVAPAMVLAPLPYVAVTSVPADVYFPMTDQGVGIPEGGVMGSAHLMWADGNGVERLPVRGVFPARIQVMAETGAVAFEKVDRSVVIDKRYWDLAEGSDRLHSEEAVARLEARLGSDLKFGLVTADRSVIECASPGVTRWIWFDGDGQGLTALARDGSLWRVDGAGCRSTTAAPEGLPTRMSGYGKRFHATDDWRVVRLESGERIHLMEI